MLRRRREKKRIVLNASDNADLGSGLDFGDKLCHQHFVSESPVARYASLDIGLPLRLEPSFKHVNERGRYHYLWPAFHRGETTIVCRSSQAFCRVAFSDILINLV